MKTNWQTKKLGEVCEVNAGNSAPQKKEYFVDGKYPFFRTSDVGVVHLGEVKKPIDYLNEKGIKRLKLFKKDTILLPKSGASTFLNHRVILAVDGYVSSHLATIKTNEKELSNKFLYYLLREIKAQDLIQDHRYPSLNLSVIENIEISFPQLSEQQRIVKILDEVFEKIEKAKENTEKNLQNSKELFESYLQSVFANPGKDWEEKKLKDVAKVEKKKNGKKDLPYVGMEDIESNSAKFLGSLSPRKVKSSSFYFSSDNILYGRLRPYLNKILLPNFEGHCSTEIFPIKAGQELNKKLLFYWFLSGKTVKEINKTCTGTRMPRANIKEVFEFKIVFPESLLEQKAIVAKLDAFSEETKKLETIYKQKLADLEELKKSILKKAFAGEL